MTEIAASVLFGDAHGFAARMPKCVEPSLIVEAVGLDDKCVAIPTTDGISHPRRVWILREFAAIGMNLARRIATFTQHDELSGCLNNLKRKHQHSQRNAPWQAVHMWILQRASSLHD